jgi:hypothetical protein
VVASVVFVTVDVSARLCSAPLGMGCGPQLSVYRNAACELHALELVSQMVSKLDRI